MSKEPNKSKSKKYDFLFYGILLTVFVSCMLFVGIGTCRRTLHENQNSSVKLEDSIESTIDNAVHIRNNSGQWQGSGVLLKSDLVLTARHVAEEGEDFIITTNDGFQYFSKRAITSKKYDLGFIKLDKAEHLSCTTKIGTIKDCRLGQTVYAIGSPFGDINQNSVTAGIISSLTRSLEEHGVTEEHGWSVSWQTDAAGNPGNSGCPVYTLDSEVVGILVGGYNSTVIYCIPPELVTNDCQAVELMFLMDEYQKEQEPEIVDYDPYYNHKENTEYY